MEVKLLQSLKQLPPKLVTVLGMVMEVKFLHPSKQPSPKLVTELGMVMEVKLLQSLKQLPPKLVTELGMLMELKPLQYAKQLFPKLVTVLGIWVPLHPAINVLEAVSIIALLLSLESYTGLSAFTWILSKFTQYLRSSPLKRIFELERVREVKPVQPSKQLEYILATEEGMLMEGKLLQL